MKSAKLRVTRIKSKTYSARSSFSVHGISASASTWSSSPARARFRWKPWWWWTWFHRVHRGNSIGNQLHMVLTPKSHPRLQQISRSITLRSEMSITNDRVCGDRRGSEVCSLHLQKTHPKTKNLAFPTRKMMYTISWQTGLCATSTNTIIYHYDLHKLSL